MRGRARAAHLTAAKDSRTQLGFAVCLGMYERRDTYVSLSPPAGERSSVWRETDRASFSARRLCDDSRDEKSRRSARRLALSTRDGRKLAEARDCLRAPFYSPSRCIRIFRRGFKWAKFARISRPRVDILTNARGPRLVRP